MLRLSLDGALRNPYGVTITDQTTVERRYDLPHDRDVVAVSASVPF